MAFLFKKQNSNYWYAGWKDENGKRHNRSTKTTARRDALKIANDYEQTTRKKRTAIHTRKTIVELHNEISGDELSMTTVRDYVSRFLELKVGETSKNGLNYYGKALGRFLEWLGKRADLDLEMVDSATVTRYRNELLKHYAPSTTNGQLKRIKTMFAKAFEEGMIQSNPAASIKPAKEAGGAQERQIFTMDQLKLMLGIASGEWRSMIIFGIYTGQRLGDLACLRWSSIDLESYEIGLNTKKSDQRILIPIADPLREHILTLEASDDPSAFVHPSLAAQYHRHGSGVLSNQFINILADCGLRERVSHKKTNKDGGVKRKASLLSFHSFRATAVTLMHEAGVPASMVEQWVGHNSKEVNRRYVKHGREALAQATSKLPHIL
jgi:integrase